MLASSAILCVASVTTVGQRLPALSSGKHLTLYEGPEELAANTGHKLWPFASAAMCRWLLENEADVRDSRILELGAGTGACGLFAAGLGATRVLLTDGREDLQRLQAKNLEANAASVAGDVSMQSYLWGAADGVVTAGPWDLIIGSDITYDSDRSMDLALGLGRLLRPDASDDAVVPRVVLTHNHRMRDASDKDSGWDEGDGNLEAFLLCARLEGLRVEQLAWERPTREERAESGCHEISVLEVSCG